MNESWIGFFQTIIAIGIGFAIGWLATKSNKEKEKK